MSFKKSSLLLTARFRLVYDVQQQKGINILTGELTAEGKALVAANSESPNVELAISDMFSEKDLIQVPDIKGAVVLNLEDGKDVVVDQESVFVISGNYTDVMIVVEVDDQKKVQLVLDGASIVNDSKPVVYVKSGDKVFVTTTDSENDIKVTGEYEADGEVTLYSTDDGINATFKTSFRAMIEVNGGVVNVAMADGDTDGFDSNGDFTINGGEINVKGGMAAFDVDGTVAFNAGNVMVDGVKQTQIEVQKVGILSKFKSN
jgi:hypothetical protein